MGIFSFIKGQLIDIIEWREDASDVIIYKYDDRDCEIKMGAQLIVRPNQCAVFVNEGRIADVFPSGRYELQTQNMPVLSSLRGWKYGFNSPFKCDIYFVNMKQFTEQKWGTSNPVMMRDREFGMIRIRAYGIYSFHITNAAMFLTELSGSQPEMTTEGVHGLLKRKIVSAFTDMLGESGIPAIDLAAQYDELSAQCLAKVRSAFASMGIEPTDITIENISLPEEVEKAMDTRTTMGVLGNMGQYAQYQTAQAIRDAAQNQSGMAGLGASVGAGAGIGQMMGQAMNSMFSQPPQPTPPEANGPVCPKCGAHLMAGAKFCAQCGQSMQTVCIHCGRPLAPDAKFCPECGKAQRPPEAVCARCGAKLAAGAKFCPECGAAQ